MTAETDLIKLYSQQILALAANMPHTTRLPDPDASANKRAPLCGSTVTVDVAVQDGVLTALGQDVKACALGQAAASVLGQVAVGQSLAALRKARDQLAAMLSEEGPVPDAPFQGFEVLIAARSYKNRHASILLAANAVVDAMEQAEAA